MSGSVFSETLKEITQTKLDEISKRRTAFEDAKSSTLSSIQSQSDPLERLALLVNGVKQCFAIKANKEGTVILEQTKHHRLEIQLKNLDQFLAQARHDPSVSMRALGEWEKDLLGHLDTQSLRYQYASLYGQLVTEWLSEPGNKKGGVDAGAGHGDDEEEEEGGGAIEDVGSAAKLKSRSEWERTVFDPADVDVDTLSGYLDDLFGLGGASAGVEDGKGKRQALQQLRKEVQAFQSELSRPEQFTQGTLKWAIQGLLSSDDLTNEKREVLRDFKGNAIILSEIADVLNMRFSALESWTWGPGGVPVEQRRKINGTFSIHMHEDLLQAIFLQYVGVMWSVFFRRAFTAVQSTKGAWTSPAKDIPELEKSRLEYFLGRPVDTRQSLQKEREKTYNSDYFVARLLRKAEQVIASADGEVEADYPIYHGTAKTKSKGVGQGVALCHRRTANRTMDSLIDDGNASSYYHEGELFGSTHVRVEEPPKSPMQLKQQLLHLLSTEIAINTRLNGGISAFHAVFRDWEILLPHETINTVLEFLGVSSPWLGFFTRYLQAPLRFAEDGGTPQPPRVRRRGVPSSHVLSDVLGETVLFFLDLAVNQVTSGQPLWRFGDDIWFWSADHQASAEAWTAVERFASVTATSINKEKSGAVCISRDRGVGSQTGDILPQGEIRWGFLVLSPETGRFEIDQTMVDSHIAELGQQLREKKHSVFALIQTWNTYAATFFSSNFGEYANCFGHHHVDDMLATHRRIQREVFSGDGAAGGLGPASSVVDYLKGLIGRRFGVTDIPDGYFYFPAGLGGLDLQSPFISLLQVRGPAPESPHDSLFEAMSEAERDSYNYYKGRFNSGAAAAAAGARQGPYVPGQQQPAPGQEDRRGNFFSFDEFVRHREGLQIMSDGNRKGVAWVHAQLMARPAQQRVEPDESSEVWTSLARLRPGSGAITNQWATMSPYWSWVTAMYGPEIVKRFGDLSMVDAGLLPMGMVGLFRKKRVTWKD